MSFIQFARAHGLDIKVLRDGDRIHRCGTIDKPKSTAGAYSWDGSRGWVWNWSTDAKLQMYADPDAKPWTDAEKQLIENRRRQADADKRQRQQAAAGVAVKMIDEATRARHDYLIRKGLRDTLGFVAADGALLMPMRNFATNDLQGVQVIRWLHDERRFEKKMLTGMKAKGAVMRLGPRTACELFFCEGAATALSIEIALKQARLNAAVMACYSASNMVYVAGLLQAPARRYVFADNDDSKTGESAAKDTGLPYCMSESVGEDANDLMMRAGMLAVAKKLMEVRATD